MVGLTTALKRWFKPKHKKPKQYTPSPDSELSASSSTPMLAWHERSAVQLVLPRASGIRAPAFHTLPGRSPPLLDPEAEDRGKHNVGQTTLPSSRRVSTNTFRSRRVSTNRRFDGKSLAPRSLVPTRTFSTPPAEGIVYLERQQTLAYAGQDHGASLDSDQQPAIWDRPQSTSRFRESSMADSGSAVSQEGSLASHQNVAATVFQAKTLYSSRSVSPMSKTPSAPSIPPSLCSTRTPPHGPHPSTPVRSEKQRTDLSELNALLIPAYASTIPHRTSTPAWHPSLHSPSTPEQRPIAAIDFAWTPTMTPQRPGMPFGDADFGDYVSGCLRTPPERPRNFCRNTEPKETFISRTGCQGAGARECETDPADDPELAAQVEAVFQRVLRQRVLSRQTRCPVSLYDLMQVEGSPTARLKDRALKRSPNVAVVDVEKGVSSPREEGNGDLNSAKSQDDGYSEEEGRSDQESTEMEGSINAENLSASMQQDERQSDHEAADGVKPSPDAQVKQYSAKTCGEDNGLGDADAAGWYEDKNWWFGGVADI